MSLNKYANKADILNTNQTIEGLYLDISALSALNYKIGIVSDYNRDLLYVDSHLYNSQGDYIKSIYNTHYKFYSKYKDFVFDLSKILDSEEVYSGDYKMVLSFLIHLIGDSEDRPFTFVEISPDRTELKLIIKKSYLEYNPSVGIILNDFKKIAGDLKESGKINNLVVNFGKNNTFHISNLKVDCKEELILYCKLINPLIDEVDLNKTCSISYKVIEDYVESILVKPEEEKPKYRILRGPSLSDCNPMEGSQETSVQTWNSLLDTNTLTSNRLITDILSGSDQVSLNLDFSNFSKFVKYGSAEERVKNYNYKFGLIGYYENQKDTILNSSASASTYVSDIGNIYTNRKNNILSNLDPFEKFLYYGSGSYFTHDITGSITPAPKFLSGSIYVNYNTGSSEYISWYSELLDYSREYDSSNYDSFYFNTPDHILRDSNNSEYFLFLHMVGQHFDNLYAFINRLTSIHERDEHPARGIPNELIPYYIRSLGWKLQNNHSLSDLWLYKLGLDSTGSLGTPTGELISQAHESLTHQIWKRTVNNLPYLLKTKGTSRSIKALFSIYGIPNTLISIKEYGGPQVDESNPPIFKEGRFQYLTKFSGGQYIEFDKGLVPPSSGGTSQVPQTTEFRFKTSYLSAPSMSMWAVEESGSRSTILQNLEVIPYSSSLYGKDFYGYLRYTIATGSSPSFTYISATSSLLPLYDGDIWSVRMYSENPVYSGSTFNGTIKLDVSKASDFIDNRVSLSSSFSLSGNSADMLYSLGAGGSNHYIVFGGTTGSNSQRFSGSLQAYREYFENYSKNIFDQKVLNPGGYYGTFYTSSYDTLYRYYTLGVDVIRNDLSVNTLISSSNPNQSFYMGNDAIAYNFTGDQTTQYEGLTETYYIVTPSLGANVPKSNKIRLEASRLVRGLSPDRKGEESRYDREQIDTNRLAIVFSPSDQLNRDISNQFGSVNFENFIGDPEHASLLEYPDLRSARDSYFKKYTQSFDIGKFIEIFSLYDYSVFEQLRQLIPARANLITGVLIEPHILQRSKIKRETLSTYRLGHETTLEKKFQNITSENVDALLAELNQILELEFSRQKEVGTIDAGIELEFSRQKETGVIDSSIELEMSRSKYTAEENIRYVSIDNDNSGLRVYTGEKLDNQFRVEASYINPSYDDRGNVITPSGIVDVLGKEPSDTKTLSSLNYSSGELVPVTASYTYKSNGQVFTRVLYTNKFIPFSTDAEAVSRPFISPYNEDTSAIGNFVVSYSGSEVPFNTSQLYDDNYIFTFSTQDPTISSYSLSGSNFATFLEKYRYEVFSGRSVIYRNPYLSELHSIHITGSVTDQNIKKRVYHYSSSGEFILGTTSPNMLKSPVYLNNRTGSKGRYLREYDYAVNKAYNAFYSSSLENARASQYFENSNLMRSRYEGSKLIGSGINFDTINSTTYNPVVVITEVNDDNIIV